MKYYAFAINPHVGTNWHEANHFQGAKFGLWDKASIPLEPFEPGVMLVTETEETLRQKVEDKGHQIEFLSTDFSAEGSYRYHQSAPSFGSMIQP